ncbi:hypothetical protein D9M70_503260 [compost metagenome]
MKPDEDDGAVFRHVADRSKAIGPQPLAMPLQPVDDGKFCHQPSLGLAVFEEQGFLFLGAQVRTQMFDRIPGALRGDLVKARHHEKAECGPQA